MIQAGLSPGHHQAVWNGIDDHGNPVAGGVYFYRLEVNNRINGKRIVEVRKMTFIK